MRRLRESHAHIAMHGRAMSMIPLGGCRSAGDLLGCVARAADAARDPAGWLVGVGMRIEGWDDPRPPVLSDLDAAARGRPCFLWSFDHHAALASGAAMKAAGIGRGTPDPPNGRIVLDGGEPTGLLLEAAAKLVWSIVPEPTREQRKAQVLDALADLAGHGFIEIDELHAPPWLGPTLASLHDEGRLDARITVFAALERIEEEFEAARGSDGWERPGLRLGGAKLFADGTLNSRTAWMLHPYADPLPGMEHGQAMYPPAGLDEAIARTGRLGVSLAVHAIGDGAVRGVLDAWERVGGGGPGGLRIEHAEIVDAADVPRFARLGVVCSVQPCHLLADIEALRRGLPHRLDRVLPLRELIESGLEPGTGLVFGSDVPIVRPDPEDSIVAAVERRRAGDSAAVAPEQAISESQAWQGFAPAVPTLWG